MDEQIIDYGKWEFPSSWDELDLKTFQALEEYYGEKEKDFDIREVLHILTHHSQDEVNSLPIDFAEKIMEGLSWLQEEPKYDEPRNYVVIDGVRYEVNIREKLKTGEYVAVSTVLKSDQYNYAAILAILCRKQGELFDLKFENEVLGSRIELFEKQSVKSVMPIVFFFINLWVILGQSIQLSSKVEEAISLTQQRIESLHKNGELSRRSMKSAMKKLKKLKESINFI